MRGRSRFLTNAMQRVIDSLLAEHADMRTAVAVLEAMAAAVRAGHAFPAGDCAQLLRYFREFVVGVHFAKEGDGLLPAIAIHGDDQTAELAGTLLREQEHARGLLHSLVLFWEPVGELTPAERDGFCATAMAFAHRLGRGMELEERRLFAAAQQVPADDRLGWREQFAHIEAQRTSAAQWHEDLAALAQRWLD